MLSFRNAMDHWNVDRCINSGNDHATPGINLVGFDQCIQSSRKSTVYNRRQSALGLVSLRSLGGSTVVFCYCLLGGDTATLSGLYARLCHTFVVIIIFLNLRTIFLDPLDRFLPFFSPNDRYMRKCERSNSSRDGDMVTNFMANFGYMRWFGRSAFENGLQ